MCSDLRKSLVTVLPLWMGCVGGVVAATGVVWDTAGARGLGDIPEGVVGGGGVVAPKGVCLGGRACGSVVAGELAAAGDG